MRIICVNTGDKYSQWYTDNLKHMIDNYSNLNYDSFEVIEDDVYELSVANKLLMFDRYRNGQNIYFDLDVLIKDDCNQFLTKELHVCNAWWRKPAHTPLNSSIISWKDDLSYIHDEFKLHQDYYMLKYNKGIDQYLYELYNPKTFTEGFCSFQTITDEKDYNVYLFNQRHEYMKSTHWCQKYFLQYQ